MTGRKLLAGLLALCLAVSLVPATGAAEEAEGHIVILDDGIQNGVVILYTKPPYRAGQTVQVIAIPQLGYRAEGVTVTWDGEPPETEEFSLEGIDIPGGYVPHPINPGVVFLMEDALMSREEARGFQFTMPEGDVLVSASFPAKPSGLTFTEGARACFLSLSGAEETPEQLEPGVYTLVTERQVLIEGAADEVAEEAVPEGWSYRFTAGPGGSVRVRLAEALTWSALQDALTNTEGEQRITLEDDVIAGRTETALLVPADASVILDLNGYTIDRAAGKPLNDGYIFNIQGALTVTDSSADGSGRLTGANAAFFGGISVFEGGQLTLEGGTISGNTAEAGGGVNVFAGAVLTLRGGTISGNRAGFFGGGVFAAAGSTIHVSGSPTVRDNTNQTGMDDLFLMDGAVVTVDGTLTKGAYLGIMTETSPTAEAPVVISEPLPSPAAAASFHSDDPAYSVSVTTLGEAVLRVKDTNGEPFHGHSSGGGGSAPAPAPVPAAAPDGAALHWPSSASLAARLACREIVLGSGGSGPLAYAVGLKLADRFLFGLTDTQTAVP